MEWLQTLTLNIGSEVSVMTGWEAVAVILAIAYLLFAMKESLWCWPAALLSTLIYTVLFWQVALLMESLLNLFYMAMAFYGFWQWRYGGDSKKGGGDNSEGARLHTWPVSKHLIIIGLTALVALGCGYGMAHFTQASMPYLDAQTTCFAILATFMLAYKVVENWLYWVAIDALSIYLYHSKEMYPTCALFVGYVVLAAVNYWLWRNQWQQRQTAVAHS